MWLKTKILTTEDIKKKKRQMKNIWINKMKTLKRKKRLKEMKLYDASQNMNDWYEKQNKKQKKARKKA